MNFFGFKIQRADDTEKVLSVVAPSNTDGSIVVDSGVYGDAYGVTFDVEGHIRNELDLIRRYRELSIYPEVSKAIEDICNEAITADANGVIVALNLDALSIPEPIKEKIINEFNNILGIMRFKQQGYELFERWYVDGKLYLQVLLHDDTSKGIAELREIDPRKIKKVKDIKKKRLPSGVEVVESLDEYFIFNDKGIANNTTNGIKLSADSVVMATSGLVDQTNSLILSCLHKAIKPANQLKMLEDAVVIYVLTRAPERRIFYIDVGGLPKGKAEQYVNDMMNKFKNKLVYDAQTGEVADSKRHNSMMEDFWMARRDGGKSTEVTTLGGGQNILQMSDNLEYFRNKLYDSLNVPTSRLKPDQQFSLGRSSEITRDEIKFAKFVDKLRIKFNQIFLGALKIQLVSKGILSSADWELIENRIAFNYSIDNHFSELKDIEILNNRVAAANGMMNMVGTYYSTEWIMKNVLRMTDEEIALIKKQNAENPPADNNEEQ